MKTDPRHTFDRVYLQTRDLGMEIAKVGYTV
jgi:hypothetical protein